MNVTFSFRTTAFMSRARYHLGVNFDGRLLEVRWPDLAAYLVNKYASRVVIEEYGFGYIADLPEDAVLALRYLLFRRTPPSKEELDEMVARGTTDLHALRAKLGVYEEGMPMHDLFLKDAVGKNLNICFRDFPRLILYNNSGEGVRIEFDVRSASAEFLKRTLEGTLSEAEEKMLKGISFLQRNGQTKYMRLLSYGLLTVDDVAKALYRAASSAKKAEVWRPLAEWLRASGYSSMASEIIAKKTLCS